MRALLMLAALASLAGYTGEYSKVPEPTGEWMPANPPSLMADTIPDSARQRASLTPARRMFVR